MRIRFIGSGDASGSGGRLQTCRLLESGGFRGLVDCGAPPYALRMELDGLVFVYSGDTEWTDRLIPAVAGSDLFVSEAYFYEKAVRFHLDDATLLRHLSELHCKRLILTHMGPDMLARVAELPVETAHDGLEISL